MQFSLERGFIDIYGNPKKLLIGPKPTHLSDNQRNRPKYIMVYEVEPSILDFKLADAMINYFRG